MELTRDSLEFHADDVTTPTEGGAGMSAVAAGAQRPVGRLTQRRIALSEWTKLRSVRSTRWALAATLLLIIGIGIIACAVFASRWPHLQPG